MNSPARTSCPPSKKASNGASASATSRYFIRNNRRTFATLSNLAGLGWGKMADIEAHESKLYSEFAPLYDRVFGKMFYNRLERVIEDLDIPPGAQVLEVGAGTGTSFPA